MKNLWAWFDGNKTTIGAISMLIVNSNYVEGLITNLDLYMLARGVAGIIFGVGITHKIKKATNKDK